MMFVNTIAEIVHTLVD